MVQYKTFLKYSSSNVFKNRSKQFEHYIFVQEKAKQRLRLMSRRRRRRHTSFEIEMNYEELTLQTLQFCVMGYDVYSRQKVIGDVLLPLAELANQGMDITRELVMWRDIQTCQPVNNKAKKATRKVAKQNITSIHQGRVVRKPVNVNPGLNVNWNVWCSLRLLQLKTEGQTI